MSGANKHITVYQQVFVDRDKTRVHTTIADNAGAVVDRRFSEYEPYPLTQIAEEHTRYLLRVIERSISVDKVVYDCNIRGRFEFLATPSGLKGKLVYHPRFSAVDKVRLKWAEPEENEEETEE